jgi:pimeloyl-ACP methyl ester carboxylesterase
MREGAAVALHEDADMDAQLARTLIGAYLGAADLGEALATALRVAPGDYDQWFIEWDQSASHAEEAAGRAAAQEHSALASSGYLRAAEYRRQSYFFLRHDLSDARVQSGYAGQREMFRQASAHLPCSVEAVSVAFDAVPLNGYLFRPEGADNRPRPTILFPGGFDGTCEEMFKYGAHSAVAMGWNAVTWDGPGQGGQLIEHGVTMRPDFESVLTPVVDWALAQPFVSADALALVGRSLGGYLAPRGASQEHRIRALVCDPGQFDFTSRFISMFSAEDWQRVQDSDPEMESGLDGFLADARSREFYGSRMAAMGAATFGAWLRTLGDYSLDGRAEQITCPTLVTEGEGDFASQSQKLFDALTCEKEFHAFSTADGAGGHCEGMGQLVWKDVVFSWLAEQLAA